MAESLSELLLRIGLLTPAGLATARAEAARMRERLAESVIDLGLVDERRFAESIARASDSAFVDPIPEDAVEAVQHHIPSAIARELNVVPLRLSDGQLFVVMVNPLDREAIEVLHAVTSRTIHPVTGLHSDIVRLVHRFYPDDSAPADQRAPFVFSNETLLRRPPELDFLLDRDGTGADQEFATIVSRNAAHIDSPDDPAAAEPPPPLEEEFGTMMARPAARKFETLPPLAPATPPGAPDEPRRVGEDSTAPSNPFVGIERRLDQIVGMMQNIEKRLDRLESSLQDHGVGKR